MKNWKIIKAAAVILVMILAGFTVGYFVRGQIERAGFEKLEAGFLVKELSGEDTCYVIGHKNPDTDSV